MKFINPFQRVCHIPCFVICVPCSLHANNCETAVSAGHGSRVLRCAVRVLHTQSSSAVLYVQLHRHALDMTSKSYHRMYQSNEIYVCRSYSSSSPSQEEERVQSDEQSTNKPAEEVKWSGTGDRARVKLTTGRLLRLSSEGVRGQWFKRTLTIDEDHQFAFTNRENKY